MAFNICDPSNVVKAIGCDSLHYNTQMICSRKICIAFSGLVKYICYVFSHSFTHINCSKRIQYGRTCYRGRQICYLNLNGNGLFLVWLESIHM